MYTMVSLQDIKPKLYQYCVKQIQQRIDLAREAMQRMQAAANEETKSSAGDKYETGRAMMQLEKEKYAQQINHALQQKKVMDQVDPNRLCKAVGLGSLVKTNQGMFYMGISLGKIELEGDNYFAISLATPLGQASNGLTAGNSFTFQGKTYFIEEIG